MVSSMSKYTRVCTVSYNRVSLHKISSKNDSTNMATNKARSLRLRAFGNMTGDLSHSFSTLTALASSTLGKSTPNILRRFSTNTANFPSTRTECATLAWTWIGTTMATGRESDREFVKFSNDPNTLTCSTNSPHDILKVSRKTIDHNRPLGRANVTIEFWVGLVIGFRLFFY